MALVPAKCTNCNGNLQIDDQKDAATCPYCGTAFVVEKAINHFNVTNNINANVVNIINQGDETLSADSLYETCLACCKKGAYNEMMPTWKIFSEKYPTDYRVYYIELLKETRNYTAIDKERYDLNENKLNRCIYICNNLKKWASKEFIDKVAAEYNPYIEKLMNTINAQKAIVQADKQLQISKLKEEERLIRKEERKIRLTNACIVFGALLLNVLLLVFLLKESFVICMFLCILIDVIAYLTIHQIMNS